MKVNPGDFVIYTSEAVTSDEELDYHGLVLHVHDGVGIEISLGESLDNCGISSIKHVIPGTDASRKLAEQYQSI